MNNILKKQELGLEIVRGQLNERAYRNVSKNHVPDF